MLKNRASVFWWVLLGSCVVVSCGEDAGTGGTSQQQAADAGEDVGSDGDAPAPDSASMTRDVVDGDTGSAADSATTSPCEPNPCQTNTRCVVENGEAVCVPLSCEELDCGPTEICEQGDDVNSCVDNSCLNDGDCPEEQWCDEICVPDLCEANSRTCRDNEVVICLPNGSREFSIPCGSENTVFESVCVDGAEGAVCSCEDDWDCPTNMTCEVGVCQGTGATPTCSLEPLAFEEVLPAIEIGWGGTRLDPEPMTLPFGRSTQSVISPVVANLDDDNGDGLVNELDFPEIIFMTFCDSDFRDNGVLRAIHGGGPNKGEDLFAVLGDGVWRAGEPLPANYTCDDADLDPTGSLAVGDLDDPRGPPLELGSEHRRRELPEIVVMGEEDQLHIYNNEGVRVATSEQLLNVGQNPAVSIANIDARGMAEIIVANHVLSLSRNEDGAVRFDEFIGRGGIGSNGQGAVSCVGDLTDQPGLEIVGGSTVYRLPSPPPGVTRRDECTGSETLPEEISFCRGVLEVVWSALDVNGDRLAEDSEGFCAIADVLGVDQQASPGPDNLLDGVPELLVIKGGFLYVYNGQTGVVQRQIPVPDSLRGGAPNVDDFDGDGFPEVGTAFSTQYAMIDLQQDSPSCPSWPDRWQDDQPRPAGNPVRAPGMDCVSSSGCADGAVCNTNIGRCVCLHNGWMRETEDNSSRVTGSTLFDFNGDSAAEVIYNDECWFRIFNGLDGAVLFKAPSESRTRIEYPIVADVDNDGNAEIVFSVSNESGFCSEGEQNPSLQALYNNGLEVWGDTTDSWVSARRVWNQHSYHVTNVMEDGRIPAHEPSGWRDLNGRSYNLYRSQPKSFGVAPDLIPVSLQVVSPGEGCDMFSNRLDISTRVQNIGDLRVGPGVVVAFYGIWDDASPIPLLDGLGEPVTRTIEDSLEPGFISRLLVSYDTDNNGTNPDRLPGSIEVRVDVGDSEFGAERECWENNNSLTRQVQGGSSLPDLSLSNVTGEIAECGDVPLSATVTNEGSLAASDILVRFYSGDPDQGGERLGEAVVEGTLEPGASREVEVRVIGFPYGVSIVVHAYVDPENTIEECNDANNSGEADAAVTCFIL